MKSAPLKNLLFLMFGSIMLVACRSSKVGQKFYCNIEHGKLQFNLSAISGFEEVEAKYPGYAANYMWLVDSLKFSDADTIALLIRPCFIHRGISFKVHNMDMNSYYFDFSKQKRKVIALTNNCDMAQNYFAFLTKETEKVADVDTVLTIPDCPVDFFLKVGSSFFYGSIPGSEINRHSSSNRNFKALMSQCDSLTQTYNKSP